MALNSRSNKKKNQQEEYKTKTTSFDMLFMAKIPALPSRPPKYGNE